MSGTHIWQRRRRSLAHTGRALLPGIALALLAACTGLPPGVEPVQDFELERYLGKWYEIARLDHSFERGLDQVSAEYSLRADGGVEVINRGYNAREGWQEARGKAYFTGSPTVGHLKVSFFGPFYASYAVFGLDSDDYQYAFVSGMNTSYLWLLARTPTVDPALKARFVEQARQLGFATDQLIWRGAETATGS